MAVVRFGDLTLDAEQALLVGPDGPIAVEPQVFAVLAHLATRPGMLVTKEELLDEIWGSRFVTESSLTSRIRAARAAVGDDGRRQLVIATVHDRGCFPPRSGWASTWWGRRPSEPSSPRPSRARSARRTWRPRSSGSP